MSHDSFFSETQADEAEQTLEEMAEMMRAAGYNVTAEQIAAEINYRQNVKFKEAMRIQMLAAKRQGERKIIRVGREAVGEVTQQIHPVLYSALRRRFGSEGLRDEELTRDLLKNHPEFRVKTTNDRLTIVRPELAGNSAPNTRRGVRGKRGRWAA